MFFSLRSAFASICGFYQDWCFTSLFLDTGYYKTSKSGGNAPAIRAQIVPAHDVLSLLFNRLNYYDGK